MSGNAFLDLLIFAIPIALASLWWTSSKAREIAISHSRLACRQRQLQFLDQTVVLIKMRPARNKTGSGCFSREYEFEFTDQGEFRDKAVITLQGHTVRNIYFPYTRDNEGNRIYVN